MCFAARCRTWKGGTLPELIIANWPLLLLLMAVGSVAGLSSGLFGIGGGAVMVPALFFALDALGYPAAMHVAVATSSAVIIVNAMRSVRGHARRDSVNWGLLRGWSVWIALGAFGASAFLAPMLSGQALGIIFVVMALIVSAQFIFGRPEARLVESPPGMPAPVVGGGIIGTLSALMGIGGGSLTVPLMSFAGVPIHRAVGTASGFGLAIALPATLGYIIGGWGVEGRPPGSLGYVSGVGFALVAATSLLSVPLGVRLAHGMDGVRLRRVFGVALLVVALNMLRELL